jgi:hypothetical protein
MTTEVSVWYDVSSMKQLENRDSMIHSLARMFGAERIAGGCGMGQRDITFRVRDESVELFMFELQCIDFVAGVCADKEDAE